MEHLGPSKLLPLDLCTVTDKRTSCYFFWKVMNNKTSGQRWTRQHQSHFLWTAMDKRTSELLPLDNDGHDNIRATSSGQRWTKQHQSYFLWKAMDKRTSELFPLHGNGQEDSRTISSGQQCTRQLQSYFFWTAMDKTAPTKKGTDYRKAHLQQHRV